GPRPRNLRRATPMRSAFACFLRSKFPETVMVLDKALTVKFFGGGALLGQLGGKQGGHVSVGASVGVGVAGHIPGVPTRRLLVTGIDQTHVEAGERRLP